jgi:hypothetical protein
MLIIYIKGSYYETPLYTHVLGDNGTVIRTRYEKGEEPRGWGGGGGEGVRRVKELSVTITCNLAVPATHHRISTIPRI